MKCVYSHCGNIIFTLDKLIMIWFTYSCFVGDKTTAHKKFIHIYDTKNGMCFFALSKI